MTGEDEIKLTDGQKVLLESVRKDVTRTDTEDSRGYITPSIIQISGTQSSNEGTIRRDDESASRVGRRKKRSTPTKRVDDGYDTRSGQTVTENINTLESSSGSSQGYQEPSTVDSPVTVDNYAQESVTPVTTERDIQRERELNAQRQKRHREAQKQAQNTAVTVTNDVTPKFQLKNPLSHKGGGEQKPERDIKLITSGEEKEFLKDLTYIYMNGSGLLDDLLEIIVKGHESVTIWQLEESEAEMLAQMHLSRGRVDKAAAASARKLVEIHDKLFFIMMLSPRVMATGKHVIEHNGVSFK